MNDDNSQVNYQTLITAFGMVFSYIGGEVAHRNQFERFLWPQRFYNGLNSVNIFGVVTIMSLGGPIHRAALQFIDDCFERGLLRSPRMGGFLDTAFYPDLHIPYIAHNMKETNEVRNGLLVRIALESGRKYQIRRNRESIDAETGVSGNTRPKELIRSRQVLVNLNLRCISAAKNDLVGLVLDAETGGVSPKVFIGVVASEVFGLILFIIILVVWKTWFSVLWIVPLILKSLAAVFTLPREGLTASESEQATDHYIICTRGIHMIISGPTQVVTQYFRHYGYPKRDRWREMTQIWVILGMALVCPAGLFSLIWMPAGVQFCWLGTQLYVTITFHIYRYFGSLASTHNIVNNALSSGRSAFFPTRNPRVWIRLDQEMQETVGIKEMNHLISRKQSQWTKMRASLHTTNLTEEDIISRHCDVDRVTQWAVKCFDFGESLATKLRANDVNGEILLHYITNETLKSDIDIQSFGQRAQIMAKIQKSKAMSGISSFLIPQVNSRCFSRNFRRDLQ
jgi:hypothetical protein